MPTVATSDVVDDDDDEDNDDKGKLLNQPSNQHHLKF